MLVMITCSYSTYSSLNLRAFVWEFEHLKLTISDITERWRSASLVAYVEDIGLSGIGSLKDLQEEDGVNNEEVDVGFLSPRVALGLGKPKESTNCAYFHQNNSLYTQVSSTTALSCPLTLITNSPRISTPSTRSSPQSAPTFP